MIEELLTRLQEEAAAEAEHKVRFSSDISKFNSGYLVVETALIRILD